MAAESAERKDADGSSPELLVNPNATEMRITEDVTSLPLSLRPSLAYLAVLGGAATLLFALFVAVTVLFVRGVGIWGINIPVAWAFAITNFVWWIGIGHAGTFISAILFLLHQEWRSSINRLAEAMTLFAVACAGLFPILHLGRPNLFYWLFPYPDTMGLWPQPRSPLVWDAFAVLTYFTISLIFWYIGLVPDLATMRDRTKNRAAQLVYGVLALGWRGSARHWHRFETSYLLLAGIATPLVVSVHSIISIDFAYAIVPGWHLTIFPPYFVAGALFSGMAMVLTLVVPIRFLFHLEDYITPRHLDNIAKIALVTGLIVTYSYAMEHFMAYYTGNPFEIAVEEHRASGFYKTVYWWTIGINVGTTQLLWFKRLRRSPLFLFGLSLVINVGMWMERFMLIVTSLYRDYMPSAWHPYRPTKWDWWTLAGSFGLFLVLMLLFARLVPVSSMADIRRTLAHQRDEKPKEGS